MGSPQAAELSLDYKLNVYPMSTSKIAVGLMEQQQPDHQQQQNNLKLQDFLSRLEEERLKIEAFKRELPLCMQLLHSAMEIYKEQLETYQMSQAGGGSSKPVLEEFIPLKNTNSDTTSSEKASWMVSAQLWSPAADAAKPQVAPSPNHESDGIFDRVSPKLALDSKQRNGGAFLPFSKERKCGARVVPDLALASSEKEGEGKITVELETRDNCVKSTVGVAEPGKAAAAATEGHTGATQATQTHRKARRCWSPELHRRFVNALQILGGSQVATPKQIRELMKVDGLTNDEVKSHLQKYRLHTRRPMQPPQPSAAAAPQLLVLGGIWVPPEYATSAAAAAPALYSPHPPPPHYCATVPTPPPPVPQDYYRAQPPHQALHFPEAVAAAQYKTRVASPDSDIKSGGGDQSESIEDHDNEGEEDKEDDVEDEEAMKPEEKALVFVTKPKLIAAGEVASSFSYQIESKY